MPSHKQRPARLTDIRVGQTYYTAAPRKEAAQGQPAKGRAYQLLVREPIERRVLQEMIHCGMTLYRSKAKAVRQSQAQPPVE